MWSGALTYILVWCMSVYAKAMVLLVNPHLMKGTRMKTRLNKQEVQALVDAQLLNKLMADNLKEVKSRVKTEELASTVVGEDCKGNVHKPYSCEGVGEIQVIDSVRESLDAKKLAEFVSEDIIKQCTKTTEVHTVNIKPDKHYAVEFENRVNKALALLDEVDNLKEEVKAKVMAMIKQQKVVK